MHTNTELLCCTSETSIILYANYNSIKKMSKKYLSKMKIFSLYVIIKGFGSGDIRGYTLTLGYFTRLLKESNEFKLNLIIENPRSTFKQYFKYNVLLIITYSL